MHDFAVSREIADLVLAKASEAHAKRVVQIDLQIGQLSHLSPDQLRYWLEQLFQGTPAQGTAIAVHIIGASLRCTVCSHEQKQGEEEEGSVSPLSLLTGFRCERCGGTTCELITGNECILDQIEIEPAE